MNKRVLLVRHGGGADDDRVAVFCAENGLTADIRRPFRGEPAGEISDDLAGVVIYGGMYNAYDTGKHPFLNDEYRLMEDTLKAGLPLLGICQGAQMLARHLGAWAGAPDHGNHEFGYYEISPTDSAGDFLSAPLHFTQAHYHTYDLPDGAVHLARSALFEQQAFRYGENAYGFQFHAEQTIEGFRRWQGEKNTSYGKPGAQDRETQNQLMHAHDAAQAVWFYDFLRGWLGMTDA